MATKTVVCPECGSPADPGRYACAECGALLAAVGPPPSGRRSETAVETAATGAADVADLDAPADDADVDGVVDPDSISDAAAHPIEPTEHVDAAGPVETVAEPVESAGSAQHPDPAVAANGDHRDDPFGYSMADFPEPLAPFDENAPLAAARRAASQPDVLRDLPDRVSNREGAPAAPAPSWPPPGDRGPLPAPEPRTPAGSYLPPSAVLPPSDGAVVGASTGPTAAGAAMTAAGGEAVASTVTAWADRASAALANPFGDIEVSVDASRRTVAVGAGIVALGLLLPWVNALPGASPISNYLERWGLAGPGAWLALAALVVLALIATGSGRVRAWPVGLPGIAMAAFMAGLIWPYAMSDLGRPIGIWVVAVGAFVLAVGGLLARGARHERRDATV